MQVLQWSKSTSKLLMRLHLGLIYSVIFHYCPAAAMCTNQGGNHFLNKWCCRAEVDVSLLWFILVLSAVSTGEFGVGSIFGVAEVKRDSDRHHSHQISNPNGGAVALSNAFKRKFTAQNIFKLTTWQIPRVRFVSLWIKLWVTKVG